LKYFNHPEYNTLASQWIVIRDLYEGYHERLIDPSYLWPHVIELTKDGQKLRSIRELRTRYTNLIEPVISAYIAIAFQHEPDISEVESLLDVNDIDGRGTSLVDFIKDCIARDYFLYGKVYLLTDSFQEQPDRAFWECIHPLAVKDWTLPAVGTGYKALRYEYQQEDVRETLSVEGKLSEYSKEYQIQDNLVNVIIAKRNSQGEWTVTNTVTLKLDRIPIASTFNGESWVKDATQEALRHYNLQSSRDNILNHQGYQRSYVAGDIDEAGAKMIGEYTIGILPENANLFTVDAVNTASIEQALAASESNVYRIAFNLQRVMPGDSKTAESDSTLRERKQELLKLIKSSISALESVINNGVQHYARFMQKNNFDGKVHLSKDVQIDDIMELIAQFPIAKPYIDKSPTWNRAIAKKILRSHRLPEEQEIQKELNTLEYEIEQPKEASYDRLLSLVK